MTSKSTFAGLTYWCLPVLLFLYLSSSACAHTYYVGASSSLNILETNSSTPGTLLFALEGTNGTGSGGAVSGDTVILENGSYDADPTGGFMVFNSGVTFQAQNWHGASIYASTQDELLQPGSTSPTSDVFQGIVLGPVPQPTSTSVYSGGSGTNWTFYDCLFTGNDGFDFGNGNLVQTCVFTDGWFNDLDVNNITTNFTMNDSIIRRANRANYWTDNNAPNKCDLSADMTFNSIIDYDNEGAGLWFDTDNTNFVVENSTFFSNHAGYNWDDASPNTMANPASAGDGQLTSMGFVDEANPLGQNYVTNNVFYDNLGGAIFYHDTGGDSGSNTYVENNLLYYNAIVLNNQGGGTYRIYGNGTFENNWLEYDNTYYDLFWTYNGTFDNPMSGQGMTFDDDNYCPDPGTTSGGLAMYNSTTYTSLSSLQSGLSIEANTPGLTTMPPFRGVNVPTYDWPPSSYTALQEEFPNTTYNSSGTTIHQVPDDETPYIHNAWSTAVSGTPLSVTVMGHTVFTGSAPNFQCYVYDYSGGYVLVTMANNAAESALDAIVPGYATLPNLNGAGGYTITLTPTSVGPYSLTATFNPTSGGSLSGSAVASSPTYALTTLGTSDWRHWGRGTGNGNYTNTDDDSSGGTQISDVSQYGPSSGTYNSWNDATRFGVTWTNGTPTPSESSEGGYIFTGYGTTTYGEGWTFTAPATTTTKTLNVLCGGDNGVELTITAVLSDGSAASYSNTITYSGSQAQVYTFTYKSAASSAHLTITIYKAGGPSTGCVDLAGAWLTTGSLSGSYATAASSYNLTSSGTSDWEHFGRGSGNGSLTLADRDSSGGSQISDVLTVNSGTFNSWNVTSRSCTWTNGSPTTSDSGEEGYIFAEGSSGDPGLTFTVPAGTSSRNLTVYTGGNNAQATVTAALSDGSAASSSNTQSSTGLWTNAFLFTYNAASNGQKLIITVTMSGTAGSGSGSADLIAAWLH